MTDVTEVIEVDRISETKVKIYTVRVYPTGARNIISVATISLPALNHTHIDFKPLEGHDTTFGWGSRKYD